MRQLECKQFPSHLGSALHLRVFFQDIPSARAISAPVLFTKEGEAEFDMGNRAVGVRDLSSVIGSQFAAAPARLFRKYSGATRF